MITFVIILAFCSAGFEIMIAEKIPAYRRLASQYLLVNLTMSIALSYALSTMFGASGLIAMTAGIASTMIGIPYYKMRAWTDNNPDKVAKIQKTHQGLKDLTHQLYGLLMIITWPVRFVRAAKIVYNKRRHHTVS